MPLAAAAAAAAVRLLRCREAAAAAAAEALFKPDGHGREIRIEEEEGCLVWPAVASHNTRAGIGPDQRSSSALAR